MPSVAMHRNRQRMRIGPAVMLVLIPVLAACGSTAKKDPYPDSMTPREFRSAIVETAGEYLWPPDYMPDPEKIADRTVSGNIVENGAEYSILTIFNECAWSLAWLDAFEHGDEEDEDMALEVMTTILPTLPNLHSSSLRWLRDSNEKAQLGDPTMVRQFVVANCQPLNWLDSS